MMPDRYGRPPAGPVETAVQSVYVLSVPSGYYKVGIAKDPEQRRRLLQIGNPETISLVGASPLAESGGVNPREMERRIHNFLRPYRANGEWFRAPLDRVYMAYKMAWLGLCHPRTMERWDRMRKRRAVNAEPSVGAATAALPPVPAAAKAVAKAEPAAAVSCASAGGSTTYRYRDPERRRAYMREHMRRRRAAAGARNSSRGEHGAV